MTPVTVHRSISRIWILALVALPFWLFGLDLVWNQRFLTPIGSFIYETKDQPAFEGRELLWGWVFLVIGLAITVWAIVEMLSPRTLLAADEAGVEVAVRGPFRSPLDIAWSNIDRVELGTIEDDGTTMTTLDLTLRDVPDLGGVWSARVEADTLRLLTSGWDSKPELVVEALQQRAGRATQSDGEAPSSSEAPSDAEAASEEE